MPDCDQRRKVQSITTTPAAADLAVRQNGDPNPSQLKCSPTLIPNGPAHVVTFANEDNWKYDTGDCLSHIDSSDWQSDMGDCLSHLNSNDWNKFVCLPKGNDGTSTSGVTFQLYKAGQHWNDPRDCYTKCNRCLAKGFETSTFVPMHCEYDAGGGSRCEAGLDFVNLVSADFANGLPLFWRGEIYDDRHVGEFIEDGSVEVSS
ncbi:MAG: hypothetical protein Q9226_001191 [Calogaya cf. arnoldii]